MDLSILQYNGITRPVTDGVTVGSQGRPSAVSVIQDLAYDLFPGEPHKVRCVVSFISSGQKSNSVHKSNIRAPSFACNRWFLDSAFQTARLQALMQVEATLSKCSPISNLTEPGNLRVTEVPFSG